MEYVWDGNVSWVAADNNHNQVNEIMSLVKHERVTWTPNHVDNENKLKKLLRWWRRCWHAPLKFKWSESDLTDVDISTKRYDTKVMTECWRRRLESIQVRSVLSPQRPGPTTVELEVLWHHDLENTSTWVRWSDTCSFWHSWSNLVGIVQLRRSHWCLESKTVRLIKQVHHVEIIRT